MKFKLYKSFILIFVLVSQKSYSSNKEYIIGVEDYVRYPFQYVEKEDYKGRFREIFDEFAKSANVTFKYKPLKINSIYNELYSGKIDFKFPDNPVWRSPQKNKYQIYYSDIITSYLDGIFVKRGTNRKTFDEIKKIGTVDDVLLWAIEKKRKNGDIDVTKSRSCAELIVRLKVNQIDAIYCNYDVMKFLLKKSKNENDIIIDTNLPLIDNYFHLSTINHPEIIKKFNIWISKNRNYIEKNIHED